MQHTTHNKMNFAFLIDKSQTFQIILSSLVESLSRGHDCTVYSTCSEDCFKEIAHHGIYNNEDFSNMGNLQWGEFSDRHSLLREFTKRSSDYHAVIGINGFNNIWKQIYTDKNINSFALEYCWNEIYNCYQGFDGSVEILCNSDWSMKKIKELSDYENLSSIGSPWFSLLDRCSEKMPAHNCVGKKYITVLAPHNSFHQRRDFSKRSSSVMKILRKYCDKNNLSLILKTRQKYNRSYNDTANFDAVLTDVTALDHIAIYNSSVAVINFCSSAINEMTFLKTPFMCCFLDDHKELHPTLSCRPGITKINEKYYSDHSFDDIHSTFILSNQANDEELINQKLDTIIGSSKNWTQFQNTMFPGDHKRAEKNIIDHVENKIEKLRHTVKS